jgi:hypothetical protein
MPLFSYFTVVGGAMMAGLFAADLFFPVQPMRDYRPVDKSVIRIHSAHVTPTPVDIVTRAVSAAPSEISSQSTAVTPVRAGF